MKRLMLAGLASLALMVAAPAASEAQVRVSVNVGPRYGYRHGYVERVYRYTPRVYHGNYGYPGYHGYRGYHGYGYPRVEVVRVYRPRPVVVVHRPSRVYRTTTIYRGRGYRHR